MGVSKSRESIMAKSELSLVQRAVGSTEGTMSDVLDICSSYLVAAFFFGGAKERLGVLGFKNCPAKNPRVEETLEFHNHQYGVRLWFLGLEAFDLWLVFGFGPRAALIED